MPFYQAGSIKYFKFSSLENLGIYHAVFTRHGGFSPTPWRSLNFGASVGDVLGRVKQNREKALAALDIDPGNVYDTFQVHSEEIIVTDKPLEKNEPHLKADGIITNKPGLTLLMRFADCVPILLVDPIQHAVGIAHAGWLGTVNKIVQTAVKKMTENYGTIPQNIIAAIGPSIGPDHYPVGEDVVVKVQQSFCEKSELVLYNQDGQAHLDLWKANQILLNEIGVQKVEVAGLCTNCHIDDWYSHRGEHGKTGRFGIILGLE